MNQDYPAAQPNSNPSTLVPSGSSSFLNQPYAFSAGLSAEECVKLLRDVYRQARTDQKNGHPDQQLGLTVDLSHKRIVSIPGEAFEAIKEETERCALAHNVLVSLPNEFALLKNLRYLNLRSNNFEEFPLALCLLPALDILDISRNKLRSLPVDIGRLKSLKIFSLAKNRLQTLPKYLGEMKDLKILKVQANPLKNPPEGSLSRAIGNDGHIIDFGELRRVLGYTDELVSPVDAPSSDEGPSKSTVSPMDMMEAAEFRSRSPPNGKAFGMKQPPLPTKNQRRLLSQSPGPSSLRRKEGPPPVVAPAYNASTSTNALISPPLNSASSTSERSRSQSDVSSIRDSRKRMGTIHVKPPKQLGTVDEAKAMKPHHMRGYSHDSKVPMNQPRSKNADNTDDEDSGSRSRSPTETEGAGPYFRRLSSLPEKKRSSHSSARIVECARGILYSLTQANQAIQQYVSFSRDRSKPLPALESVLYNAKSHTAHLISALETYEEKGNERDVDPILDACDHCVQVFRHVVTQLHSNLHKVALDMDIRFTRTLLLLLYGVHIELQTAWASIRPILPQPPGQNPESMAQGYGARQQFLAPNGGMARGKPGPYGNGHIINQVATPRTPDTFNLPTPGIHHTTFGHDTAESNQDDDLFENVNAATSNALLTLLHITDAVQKISLQQSLPPSTQLKIQDLKMLCQRGSEVARRLKTLVPSLRDHLLDPSSMERKRFWDETNFFIKHIIDIAEICKLLKSEYAFPSQVANNLSTLIRLTKNLSILNSTNTMRLYKEPEPQNQPLQYAANSSAHFQSLNNQFAMPSTPLSAALGAAVQATVLQPPNQLSQSNLSALNVGRTETMLSSRTMTGLSEFGPNYSSSAAVSAGMNAGLISPAVKEHKTPPPLRLS